MKDVIFRLENFEGPLDLLLHLISKHKLNIEDIEIAKLLEQYLLYLDNVDGFAAGIEDFLEMAARLIYIKTVSLLPKPEKEPDDAEALKRELQERLLRYEQCKIAAALLKERYGGSSIFARAEMKLEAQKSAYSRKHAPSVLKRAYANANRKSEPPPPPVNIDHIIKARMFPVTTKVVAILRRLYKKEAVVMDALYEDITDRSERVAVF